MHDFKGELGRAVPYGVYDMTASARQTAPGTPRIPRLEASYSGRAESDNLGRPLLNEPVNDRHAPIRQGDCAKRAARRLAKACPP